jgi:hypothetical protein
MNNLEAALFYAAQGWPVLPILPNGKLPATQHGVHDATTDADQLRRWFDGRPDLNVAIAAGERSGLVVFDIDPRNGGEASWEEWTAEHGTEPSGTMQLTAGGGQHYLAAWAPGIRSAKLRNGIDLLSDGRYFLAFPSTIEGRSYAWEASSDPWDGVAPFTIPQRWLENLTPRKAPERLANASLIQGSRNDGLTALAGAMRRYGMTEAEILAAIAVANETRCEIPLPASEVAQIARSVGRYDVEADVAANAALGADAAEELLAAVRAQTTDYFFTRATSYLSQPAALRWVIKGWVPERGCTMVYGESGAGKTFVTLDMACHIAAGLSWCGIVTKPGLVVYMAGEGNYGIRQRVAAWCKRYGIQKLDNLLISNKAIDLDAPNAAAQILNAVRELTSDDAVAVMIDTVNNHMAGDENSARDVRNLFNAANLVAAALNAAVILNHHMGHSAEAKNRARGSSAFKASLDAAIQIAKGEGELLEISCTKMKDAEPPATFAGRLAPVALGWLDDEGQEIIGAVFERSDETPQPKASAKKASPSEKFRKTWEAAWWKSGCELRDGLPYVSRSALREYLTSDMGMTETSAGQYLKPASGKLIGALIDGGVIQTCDHGWAMLQHGHADALRIALNGGG